MKRKYILQTGTIVHYPVDLHSSCCRSCRIECVETSRSSHLESNTQATTLPFSVLQLKTSASGISAICCNCKKPISQSGKSRLWTVNTKCSASAIPRIPLINITIYYLYIYILYYISYYHEGDLCAMYSNEECKKETELNGLPCFTLIITSNNHANFP